MAANTRCERQEKASQQEGRSNSGLPLTYTVEVKINLLDFDPKYPKDPKTFGGRIRKARMDQHLMVKELAKRVGVVPETVINWEKHNLKPTRRHWEQLRTVLELGEAVAGSSQGDHQSHS